MSYISLVGEVGGVDCVTLNDTDVEYKTKTNQDVSDILLVVGFQSCSKEKHARKSPYSIKHSYIKLL
jgi:hypothetical protein